MTDEEKKDEEKKKKFLLLFLMLLQSMNDPETQEEALYELAAFRAEVAIAAAISGFNIDFDEAMELIRKADDSELSDYDKDRKDRLVAAVNNLIEFAACEEYHLMKDAEDEGLDDINWDDEDDIEPFVLLNKQYNETYTGVEDGDIEYAMAMAATWITWESTTMITYMTQNDDRVRPWHQALYGFTAKRDEFPTWMIPPIEWACRCYLEVNHDTQSSLQIMAKKKTIKKPEELDGVFKESVCKCGRIFSDEHPYFTIDKEDEELVSKIVNRIKEDYYG